MNINNYSIRFLFFILLAGTICLQACDNNDPEPADPQEQRLTTGFIISGLAPDESVLVKYYEELPSGTVDLSDGKDFQQFFPVDAYGGALFTARPDGSAGFAKIMVDGNGEVIEDSFISTVDEGSFQIAVRDENTGVFQDRNFPNRITVFDPSTMTESGTIDMSAGIVPDNIPQRYQTFYFRNEEVFAPLRGNEGETYDSLVVHVANLSTGTYSRTISFDGGRANPYNDFGQNDIDEDGNLYIPDQGDVNTATPASLHKIPAGSDTFDPDYEFNIAVALNPSNVFLPIFRGFYYVADGMALALVATSTPQEVIDVVTAAGGVQNLSPDQIQQVLGLLFTAENGRWCKVDVNAQTVTPIDGIPSQSVFATAVIAETDGKLLLPITTPAINALYSYDPVTDDTEKVFDVTAGGALIGVYNIANNN